MQSPFLAYMGGRRHLYVASFSNTKKTSLGNVLVNICPNEKKCA